IHEDVGLYEFVVSLQSVRASLLYLRLAGEFSAHSISFLGDTLEKCRSLLFFGFHNTSLEPVPLGPMLADLCHHRALRHLDMAGTRLDEIAWKQLGTMLLQNESIAGLSLTDEHLVGQRYLEPALAKQRITTLQLDPPCPALFRIYTQLTGCSPEDPVEIHRQCRTNGARQRAATGMARALFKVAKHLLLFDVPTALAVRVLSFLDPAAIFGDTTRLMQPTTRLSCPFPFTATVLAQRLAQPPSKGPTFDEALVRTELANINAPDWFLQHNYPEVMAQRPQF
ncbi:hypothetical protein HDU91_004048, partial [Kappamyces sp. JEL0680]